MLTSFTVQRYKPFVDRTRIELCPLTLLFGYNNAGKSALLRALPLLADSLLDSGPSPLKRGPASRGGTFDDLISRLQAGRTLGIGLTWDDDAGTFGAEIKDLPERHRQLVTELFLTREGRKIEAHWIPREDAAGRPDQWYELVEGETHRNARIEMRGLIPHFQAEEDPEGWGPLFAGLRDKLHELASGVRWLSSLRAAPGRSFQPGDASALRIEPDGRGVEGILFFDRVERGGLLREVSAWFEEDFQQVLDLHEVGDSAYLSLSPLEAAGLRIPLADTGEGMAQVLPVLVALAMARQASGEGPQLLALEQPELHLHPAAEVALARRFAETAAMDRPPVLVVETHSENLMLSVQLQIAEDKIRPEAVAVYWIERLADGRASVRRIELDEKGQAHGWPRGVFSEDVELARQLYLRRKMRAS